MHNTNCPVCSSQDVEIFFEIPDIPVHCNVLLPTHDEAVNVPRGSMRLGFCHGCGHIYNYSFRPELLVYTQTYENSLHFSPRFQVYAESLARDLIERHDLYHKNLIEVGCGKGDFLRLMCDLGDNRGVGFDASYIPEHCGTEGAEKFTVIQDFYSERYAGYKADFICCRQVLEHIESPRDFLSGIRKSIGGRAQAVVFFEVPNVMYTLRDLGIWDLIYEHCSYFSSSSLSRLFTLCGFEVYSVTDSYEGQFLSIEVLPSRDATGSGWKADNGVGELSSLVKVFADHYQNKVVSWRENFEKMANDGKKAVVWGGGSKGITFLNVLKIQDQIEYMVDINPRKQGMYTAGTGQKIVEPVFLPEYEPDVIIVMNPIYKDEIRGIIEGLGLNPEYMYG